MSDLREIDVAAQLRELDRADYEDSLYLFLRAAWSHIDPAPWVDGWVGEAIAEHLEAVVDGEIRRLIINIPPRTLKTSLTSIAFPAWVWAQRRLSPTSGPGVKFMYASYGDSLSMEHNTQCRWLLKSDWYQSLWGDRYGLRPDQDTKHKFVNDKGGERQVTSIGGRVTGRGGQIVVIDDPNATNDVSSESAIQRVLDWYDQTMSSRLNDRETGAFIVVQQRVAENDLTGHLLEKNVSDWTHLCLPMLFESDRSFYTPIGWKDPRVTEGELLWPERFSPKVVDELSKEVGPWVFAGQYQQRPEPKGGGIIKREWWLNFKEDVFPPMDYIVASLDTAYTEKTENDYSAITVWGVFSQDPVATASRSIGTDGRPVYIERVFAEQAPKVMLIAAWQERLPIHQLVEKTAKTCKDKKVDRLIIENKAAGISVGQELRRLYGNEAFAVQLYDPKSQDKLARLYSVQHLFAEGLIYAPDRAWADQVITQVGVFPHGKHDDYVDTVSQALRHLREIGLLTRSAERMEEIEAMKQYRPDPPPLYPG